MATNARYENNAASGNATQINGPVGALIQMTITIGKTVAEGMRRFAAKISVCDTRLRALADRVYLTSSILSDLFKELAENGNELPEKVPRQLEDIIHACEATFRRVLERITAMANALHSKEKEKVKLPQETLDKLLGWIHVVELEIQDHKANLHIQLITFTFALQHGHVRYS